MTTCSMVGDVPEAPAFVERTSHDLTLAECLVRIGNGDESAMARFYDETRTKVHSLVCRVLGVATDADEVTLDVYFQVWRTASRYDARRGSVAAWLSMMARSRAIDRLRSAGSPALPPPLSDEDAAFANLAASDPDPEQANLANAERARIRSALRALSPEQRQAIRLAFFRGLTHRELAAHLGEPLGTVKTRIRCALQRLRAALHDGAEPARPPFSSRDVAAGDLFQCAGRGDAAA